MKLHLTLPQSNLIKEAIKVTGSKSESNRMLLLQALYPNLEIDNISNSDDAQVMAKGLKIASGVVDIHHAGTAMRFLTAYFASQEGKEVVLTGSQRMTERPIGVLVDALNALGAEITYEKNVGYPPLKIKGKKLSDQKVSLPADISSQYISALLLNAAKLENGLELALVGKITSVPYIKMTLALLTQLKIENSFEGNSIKVFPKKEVKTQTLVVESDWSSASYFYSIVALSEIGSQISLSSYKENSLQGDSVLSEIYTSFGVETVYQENSIILKKIAKPTVENLEWDLANAPDIAQTIAVTCFGLQMSCYLTGLHTLKIKETDRLEALDVELSKLGAAITVTDKTLTLKATTAIHADVAIDTYNDHRMAMAFAPLALKTTIFINNAEVVSKSFPDFWRDMATLGIGVQEQ
ncbi:MULTISPECIES: 3-phosphoshikimate 1-carboxyvinyltransferase [Cellulophaga]|uniref:3-phosphoshikimate 1-carboxyvinyltransferase n=1 Tax=Cellulophaga baltica 18 TaxID=1348584 RepID=A0AAU8RR04_9FLAO|nr:MULTISPECIES: 3-phosphoshikimate 1-carboxyvinyltransferase [Cellulophaga]AIY13199.1 3-phosphoshikimate 1-carboxyvinyltransferase [Cellulophaga baltica NN016038]AIZ41567.1 3-phosphoshikimate 1-carboxyvinyltransferase [Cellulophaga baltica 18]KGK31790.1 3-phosphoshikimate 1-carboxyvinyltransferase [Cellulophaga sp. E6(2014)]